MRFLHDTSSLPGFVNTPALGILPEMQPEQGQCWLQTSSARLGVSPLAAATHIKY